jgi:1-acyl-sn-glycerol-3-phosphate acyltransferase
MAHHKTVLRAVTDEITYTILRLSGQEYVDRYAADVKAGQARGRRG